MRYLVILIFSIFLFSCSQSPEYYLKRGNSFYISGDYYKAIDMYSRAILNKVDYADAYVSRAMAWEKLGDKMKAIDDYMKAIMYNSHHLAALNNLASIYIEMSQYDKALSYIEKALEVDPSYRYAYYNRGIIKYYTGFVLQAVDDFTKAIEMSGDSMPLARYYRAVCYYKAKMFRKAYDDIVHLIKTSNANDVVYYTASKIMLDLEPHAAVEYINNAIKMKEDPLYYYTRAVINEKLSKISDAINDINTAIKLSNFSKSSYLYYASDLYIKTSNLDIAKKYCDMALEYDKNSIAEYKKRISTITNLKRRLKHR